MQEVQAEEKRKRQPNATFETMSFLFHLYRAPVGLPPINHWDSMMALPLGSLDQVKTSVATLFPEVRWKFHNRYWFGLGPNDLSGPYLDIMLTEDEPGTCHFVVLNKAAPSTMRKIMESMSLNYVCAMEAGDLVDPYAYRDEDACYAKREWTRPENARAENQLGLKD